MNGMTLLLRLWRDGNTRRTHLGTPDTRAPREITSMERVIWWSSLFKTSLPKTKYLPSEAASSLMAGKLMKVCQNPGCGRKATTAWVFWVREELFSSQRRMLSITFQSMEILKMIQTWFRPLNSEKIKTLFNSHIISSSCYLISSNKMWENKTLSNNLIAFFICSWG